MQISVTILTKNSALKLKRTLDSTRNFHEVIILDSGSTDATEEIARSYPNVKFYKSDFLGFGPMKKKAASYASSSWILNVDSDEVLSQELLQDIFSREFKDNVVYGVDRRNHYCGKWIKGCDWYPDAVFRLYNKNKTDYDDAKLHEKILVREGLRLEKLSGEILHYPYEDVSGLIKKLDHYSTLYAEEKRGKSVSLISLSLRTLYSFFRNYILKRGIFLGREGLLISFCSAAGVFYKNMKLLEENEKNF